jgi:hypothetical protein
LCAISDALGGVYFNRTPIVADMIINVFLPNEAPENWNDQQAPAT